VTSDEIVYTRPTLAPQSRVHGALEPLRVAWTCSRSRRSRTWRARSNRSIFTFQPLVDPEQHNRLYAMQIEWKLMDPERRLLVKQARPYSFGGLDVPEDCREF
jgi:hypothetical protein